MKGLSPWLVLIGPTPLKLVEDWFTAVVILKLNPSPTGSFIIVFKRRKIVTCVLFYSVTQWISSQQKNRAQPALPGGGVGVRVLQELEMWNWLSAKIVKKPSKQAFVSS